MNARIKLLRNKIGLTQEKFAGRIGLKQNSIALIESGKRNISDQAVLSICREFGVREEWLRTGKGEMFAPAPTQALDALAIEKGLTRGEYILIQKFLELKPGTRRQILLYIRAVAEGLSDDDAPPMGSLEEAEAAAELSTIPSKPDLDIDAEVERYRQELLSQRQAADGSFPSAGSNKITG